jgi:hypothetical protein
MLLAYYFPDLERLGEKLCWIMIPSLTQFLVRLFLTLFSSFFVKNLENSLKLRWRLAFHCSCDENPNQD